MPTLHLPPEHPSYQEILDSNTEALPYSTPRNWLGMTSFISHFVPSLSGPDPFWAEEPRTVGARDHTIRHNSPLSGPMIALYAGPDNLPFYVHPNVMSASSDYFRGRFGGSKVPPEHELHLHFPEIDVKDMASFTNYMYRLFWKDYDIQLSTRPNQDLVDHVKLYITGCIFEVPFLLKYVGEVITYLLNKENRAYILSLAPADFAEHLQSRMELVGLVYDNTDEDDMLRTVFVKDMALHSDDYYERGVEHNIDMDFSLREFFRGVPKFSDDLKGFVPRTDEKEEDAGPCSAS